jgi:hypothetical protein
MLGLLLCVYIWEGGMVPCSVMYAELVLHIGMCGISMGGEVGAGRYGGVGECGRGCVG